MARTGKTSLPHLYVDEGARSGKMISAPEALELFDYIFNKEKGLLYPENFHLTEKIDGSTTMIGWDDEGFFATKCGCGSHLFRANDEDCHPKAKDFLRFGTSPELGRYLESLRQRYNQTEIRVQEEMLLTAWSHSKEYMQAVLVPYDLSKFPRDGASFIVRVVGADLQLLPNQKEVCAQVAALLDKPTFFSAPIQEFARIDYKPIDVNDLRAFLPETDEIGLLKVRGRGKDTLIDKIRQTQKELQTRVTEAIPESKLGGFYEGLVASIPEIGLTFKMTSATFKKWYAEFNNVEGAAGTPEGPDEPGVWPVEFRHRTILMNKIGPGTETVALLLGHFEPFTGPNGHGRLITEFKKATGEDVKKVIIGVIGEGSRGTNFTQADRVKIAQAFIDEYGYEGVAVPVRPSRSGSLQRLAAYLLEVALSTFKTNKIRPVVLLGPDRPGSTVLPESIPFASDVTTTYPEYWNASSRGASQISATMIRELLAEGDTDQVAAATGYSKKFVEKNLL